MGDVLIVALRCSDESITAARVDIEYRDILGLTHTLPLTTEIMFGNGGVFTVLPEIRIIRILFTARKDAGSF